MENSKDKAYIGRTEAYELLQELFFNDFQALPRKGKEYVNVPAIASGRDITTLGKDEAGYYVMTETQPIINQASK